MGKILLYGFGGGGGVLFVFFFFFFFLIDLKLLGTEHSMSVQELPQWIRDLRWALHEPLR